MYHNKCRNLATTDPILVPTQSTHSNVHTTGHQESGLLPGPRSSRVSKQRRVRITCYISLHNSQQFSTGFFLPRRVHNKSTISPTHLRQLLGPFFFCSLLPRTLSALSVFSNGSRRFRLLSVLFFRTALALRKFVGAPRFCIPYPDLPVPPLPLLPLLPPELPELGLRLWRRRCSCIVDKRLLPFLLPYPSSSPISSLSFPSSSFPSPIRSSPRTKSSSRYRPPAGFSSANCNPTGRSISQPYGGKVAERRCKFQTRCSNMKGWCSLVDMVSTL